MRDPLGSIIIGAKKISRNLYRPLRQDHFLHDAASAQMVARGQLVPFTFASDIQIDSPRIPFVTYPHEWCNAQFFAAADLTLAISEDALAAGYELKDASAWNVIFDGGRPVFCDHLSFQKIEDKRWWAFAQFVRHFIFPLCIAKYRALNAKNAFKIHRDGMSPDHARTLMGMRRFSTRFWLLMLRPRDAGKAAVKQATGDLATNHKNLYAMIRWFLNGVGDAGAQKSAWINYTDDRDHYTRGASGIKYETVRKWLASLSPEWVLDLGCNTGEFSKLAASVGANVVAVDLDHESIQNLYLSIKGEAIYPVIANLDDLAGGRGWGGAEFPGLMTRLDQHADVTLMLAVVHHLAISSSIPYEQIAAIAARTTSRYLIVELLDSTDPLAQRLADQRNRDVAEFSMARQREAFDQLFHTRDMVTIPETSRHLFLMEKR